MTRSTLEQLGDLVTSGASVEVLDLALESIRPDPEQPRREFEGIEELAASVRTLGLQQPLWVRATDESGHYHLVAGERRYQASQKAGLTTLPCIVLDKSADDPTQRLILQLTENIQRRDLTMMEVAQAIRRLVDELSMPKQDVARLLGKSPTFVSKHLALLDASGVAREALSTGRLRSPETFRLFNKLPSSHQQALLDRARRDRRPIRRVDVSDVHAPRPPDPPTVPPESPYPTDQVITLKLKTTQAQRLLERLGVEAPDEPKALKQALLQLI